MSAWYLLATLALGAIALWQTFMVRVGVDALARVLEQHREMRREIAAALTIAGDAAQRGDMVAYRAEIRRATLAATRRVSLLPPRAS